MNRSMESVMGRCQLRSANAYVIRCLLVLSALAPLSATAMDTVGNVRVSCLSPTLVRIEEKNAVGAFEDRTTLMVVERNWPSVQRTRSASGSTTTIGTSFYEVLIPSGGNSISGVSVVAGGQTVFTYNSLPSGTKVFPAPDELSHGYVLADTPRVIPPAWGSVPAPANALQSSDPLYTTQGWDYRYLHVPDVYVFVNKHTDYFADYATIRKDFLRLTGPIPMVPLYFLGFANSRYQAISQSYILSNADRFRSERIPVDIYIVDTDWRSNGYSYNSTFFPQPLQFFSDMHSRGFRVSFNDHPGGSGVDFQGRWDGLTARMNDGLDFWWYDLNWGGIMSPPVAGIDQAMWGMKMYWDMQKKFLKDKYGTDRRVAQYSMRSGGTNYNAEPVSGTHPGSHRYPGWWTGDIGSGWDYNYRPSIDCSVHDGVRLLPYVNHDIGGFLGCDPGDELYTRWMQYGSLSPQPKVHGNNCGEGVLKRYPWEFSTDTKNIIARYLAMRYRLMPMLYRAVRTCYDDGTPLLQRCDLQWPSATYPQAKLNSQYLFGNDILVKPVKTQGAIMSTPVTSATWLPPGIWYDAWTGEPRTGSTPSNANTTASSSSSIWHIPMYVRQGAIITLCDNMQYTSEKPWDPITCEVYPPPVGGNAVRSLYEDDKETSDYEQGKCSITRLETVRESNGMAVLIGDAKGQDFTGKLGTRSWIVRIHLDKAYANEQIAVNGTVIPLGTAWTKGTQAQARKLDPAQFPATVTSENFPIPLQGEGQAPGPQAPGPVIEVWLPSTSTSIAQAVTLGTIAAATQSRPHSQTVKRFAILRTASGQAAIAFVVPQGAARTVRVTMCSLKGETVGILIDGIYSPGSHQLPIGNLGRLGKGTYVVRLTVNGIPAASVIMPLQT